MGFESDHVITASFVLGRQRYSRDVEQLALFRELEQRLAAVARGGSYRFGGGNGSRTGSGRIFVRIALSVTMRGDNGYRSPSMMRSSSLSSAVFSSSVRSRFMTGR